MIWLNGFEFCLFALCLGVGSMSVCNPPDGWLLCLGTRVVAGAVLSSRIRSDQIRLILEKIVFVQVQDSGVDIHAEVFDHHIITALLD